MKDDVAPAVNNASREIGIELAGIRANLSALVDAVHDLKETIRELWNEVQQIVSDKSEEKAP